MAVPGHGVAAEQRSGERLVLGAHLGQYLIEMRLAERQRALSCSQRGQDRAADEFFDVGSRHAFGRCDHRGYAAVERHVASVEPQQLFPAYCVRPWNLDREVHPARPVGEGLLQDVRPVGGQYERHVRVGTDSVHRVEQCAPGLEGLRVGITSPAWIAAMAQRSLSLASVIMAGATMGASGRSDGRNWQRLGDSNRAEM